MSQKFVNTAYLLRKFINTRLSIAFTDLLDPSITPQVVPPCSRPSWWPRTGSLVFSDHISIRRMVYSNLQSFQTCYRLLHSILWAILSKAQKNGNTKTFLWRYVAGCLGLCATCKQKTFIFRLVVFC